MVWRSVGSLRTIRSTCGWKPMSSIRSASSSTRIFTSSSFTSRRSTKSVRRPGVAMRMLARPTALACAIGARSSATWAASSRVGVSTSADGVGPAGSSRSTRGMANARVLPEPVCDFARTSRPAMASGTTSDWMGKGAVMPRWLSARTTAGDAPRSMKVGAVVMFHSLCRDSRSRVGPGRFCDTRNRTRRDEEAKPHGTAMAVRWPKGTRDPRPGREDGTLGRMRGPTGDMAHRLAVARGDEPADAVLAGGRVLSVFTGELLDADVALAGEHVAGVGRYEGRRRVDASGLILLPGFIDGHMHIESTKLPPDEFARAALPWGTTTAVLDPHEIANVFGLEGVRALMEASRRIPLDFFALVPLVLEHGPANCLLCTDDREPDHLLEEGHINDVIRRAVALGCSPSDAVTMGTLNAARYHRLYEHGAVAPGYLADIVAVEDLHRFQPVRVWKRGRVVAEEVCLLVVPRPP